MPTEEERERERESSTDAPLSIGNIYSTFTAALGFRPGHDEGKTEALAAFGRPVEGLLGHLKASVKIANNEIYLDGDAKCFVRTIYLY